MVLVEAWDLDQKRRIEDSIAFVIRQGAGTQGNQTQTGSHDLASHHLGIGAAMV